MNTAVLETDLTTKQNEARSLLERTMQTCQAHVEKDKDGKVISTGRLMTDEERQAIQAKIDDANAIKARLTRAISDQAMTDQIAQLTGGLPARRTAVDPNAVGGGGVPARRRKTLGEQFVASEAFAWLQKNPHSARGSQWTSPSVELTAAWHIPAAVELMAATLTEDAASGGDLIIPDYRPGILPLLFKRLVVADLIAPGTTDSNLVSYMQETTFTNAADTVAEAAAKPESTLIFDLVSDTVRKIAHWLPVTEEMLEDSAQIRSYIDARLRLGVQLAEEDQLLNGTTTPPDIVGILNRTGLTAAQARGTDTNADAIYKEMMKIFNAAFLMPDGTVINSTNWQTIALAKDANGQYYGAGPFASALQLQTLWGLPVVVTPTIAAGTALTGAFRQASQIFRKGGIRVEASNSHSDYFIKNLVAIRAEERLALAVYRPAAFGTITGLN